MTRRPRTRRSFKPSTRITNLTMRRRIHDAKTTRARHFAAHYRSLVRLSAIAAQLAVLLHHPHAHSLMYVR